MPEVGFKKRLAKATWPARRRLASTLRRRRALSDMRLLEPVAAREAAIDKARRLMVCHVHPGVAALDWFLEHHRRIGVDHVLCIDEGGSEEVSRLLAAQEDCSVWKPVSGVSLSGQTHRFYNALIHRHCIGKWTLTIRADEHFIFPYVETRGLADLIGQLEDCERATMWAVRVETYGSSPVADGGIGVSEERFFDSHGYHQSYGKRGQLQVRGGVPARILEQFRRSARPPFESLPPDELIAGCPDAVRTWLSAGGDDALAPAGLPSLHRIPLARPDCCFFYESDNKFVADEKSNWPHKWHPCPTGVLLGHAVHRQAARGSGGGWDVLGFEWMLRELVAVDPRFSLRNDWSVPCRSSRDLIEAGLLCDGAVLRPPPFFGTLRQTAASTEED